RSITATRILSCAARIAATYPPGPEPITTRSYREFAKINSFQGFANPLFPESEPDRSETRRGFHASLGRGNPCTLIERESRAVEALRNLPRPLFYGRGGRPHRGR